MNIPGDLLYNKDHEWVRIDGETATIGITDFAQGELGDVVYVQLPEVGATIGQGDVFGTIEAVKAVADLYAPVTGEIIAVNQLLEDAPETINSAPYGDGWILQIRMTNANAEKPALLDAAAYIELTSAV